MKKVTLLLIFSIVVNLLYSQTPIRKFTHYDEFNGIVQAVVSGAQDSQGFLWFGTEGNNGVFRYDGKEFIQFKNDPANPDSIVHGNFYSTVTDSNGDVWFGSDAGGLSRYNSKSGTFTNFTHDPEDDNSISSNRIYTLLVDSRDNLWISTRKSIEKFSIKDETITHFYPDSENPHSIKTAIAYHSFESRDGTIWFGTYGQGLAEFNPETERFKTYLHDPDNPLSIANNTSGGIVEDEEGYIWVGGRGGLNRLDRETGEFKRFVHSETDPNTLLDNYVWDIVRAENGDLWLGGFGGGLSRFDPETEKVYRHSSNSQFKEGMSSNLIFFLFIDNSNVLWAGTVNGGLNKYNFSSEQFSHYGNIPGDDNSFTTPSIFTIYQDSNEYIWLGYQGHNSGLTQWDRSNAKVYNFLPGKNSVANGEILSIVEDQENRLFLGQYGLYEFDKIKHTSKKLFPKGSDVEKFDGKTIKGLKVDNEGNLWAGTDIALVKLPPDRESYEIVIDDINIKSINFDNDGYLWIGTGADGLRRYNPETNKIVEYRNNINDPNSIADGEIITIYQDSKERLWVGVAGGGLNLFNKKTDNFTHYNIKDGFASNSIFSIVEDNNENLWMGTSWGLIKFNPESKEVINFTKQDGLQGNEFSIRSNGAIKGKDGDLYFVGKKGLTVFNPDNIKLNTNKPPIILTSIKLFNKEYESDISPGFRDELKLSWKDNMVTFSFAAMDFKSPEHNHYMYMLEGFDKEWIDSGNFNQATYTNLDGGSYTFKVKASNNHDLWNNEGLSLKLVITPRWWRTWWAILLFIAGILIIIYIRISLIEKQKRVLENEVQIRTFKLNQSLTDLENTQEQLIESGKMAALGSLVAGVAHEINTPLGIGVTGISHLNDLTEELEEKNNSGKLSRSYLNNYITTAKNSSNIALRNMEKAAKLINNFKNIAVDQSNDDIREFKIEKYITNILTNLAPKLKQTNHIINITCDEDFTVSTYPGAISQIITNLTMNSLIHGFENIREGKIDIDISLNNSEVILKYRDDGSGIPENIRTQIFEPFITTKRNKGGTGLGMHIVYNLVTQTLKGSVKCVDTNLSGSLFIIKFPQNLEDNKA